MSGERLVGLEGTNPLGFLSALGIQVAFATESDCPCLWWSDDVVPCAVVDDDYTPDRISKQVMNVLNKWRCSPSICPRLPDGSAMPKGDDLKLSSENIRLYLANGTDPRDPAGSLTAALVAEGSLDRQGVAKPSDLYFTAGQQKFLGMARQILNDVSLKDVVGGLEGPWKYESESPSLGWDVVDDRVYALRACDPSGEKKYTNLGPEALAILGLSMHPVFAGRDRTLTQGCSGTWKDGSYSWPLWDRPASAHAVKSLLAHAYDPQSGDRHRWLRSWGVFTILCSHIRRSGQGGYGTFSPPEVIWRAR